MPARFSMTTLLVVTLMALSSFSSSRVFAQSSHDQSSTLQQSSLQQSAPSNSAATSSLPSPSGEAADPILQMLQQRVQRNPQHSDSWRLLATHQTRLGRHDAAFESLSRALSLDPDSAAAHHDLGRLQQTLGDDNAAQRHFDLCVSLAPDSKYAEQLIAEGGVDAPPELRRDPADVLPSFAGGTQVATAEMRNSQGVSGEGSSGQVDPVGYRIQTFDGEDDLQQRFNQLESQADESLKRLRVFLETGVLYNGNVSLTPISRELANADAESLQGIFNPEVEWIATEAASWRTGLLTRGFFTVNESSHRAFDLASFQPGAFAERDFTVGMSEWIGRLEYVYALDLLDGDRVGDRHSVTASMIVIRPDLDVIYTYFTTAFSQFDDDGVTPTTSSLDGTSYTGGISRFFQTECDWLPNWNLGVDLEAADTEGSDFRYRGINGHGEFTFQWHPRWQFIPSAGVGYRDYYDFTGPVSRDELTWRAQGKLRWQWTDATALALVAGHDRFASDNDDFDAERTQGGLILTYVR